MLGESVDPYRDRLAKLAAHTLKYGIDPVHGGVYVEGPHDGPARDLAKEFWQQAETLVGMLDAYLLLGDRTYRDAFRSTFEFVWRHLVNHDLGEWYALADRDGTIRWDYLGHAWKNNYHTTRSMVQVLKRLRNIEERGLPAP